MKIRYLYTPSTWLRTGAAALALALALTQTSGAGILTLSGGVNSGGTITGVTIDSAGNITVTGTPAGGGGGGVPLCSLGASRTAIAPGETSTLTANCTSSPNGYTWTGGPPTASGSSATLAFPTAGSFTYTVAGTNGSGGGLASNAVTVVVATPAPAPPPGNCPAIPAGTKITNYAAAWSPQGTTPKQLYRIVQNEIVAIKFTADGPNPARSGQVSWVPNNNVSSKAVVVNISKCPGDFSQTGVPLTYLCRGEGEYSTLFYTQNSTSDYQCPIATGDYYINVRSGIRPNSASPIDPSYTIIDNCPSGVTCGVTVEFK